MDGNSSAATLVAGRVTAYYTAGCAANEPDNFGRLVAAHMDNYYEEKQVAPAGSCMAAYGDR